MALEIRQSLRLQQQLVMTPQLQQAIKLLQYGRLELLDTIQQELTANPVLEEVAEDEGPEAPDVLPESEEAAPVESEKTVEVNVEESAREGDIDWENYLGEYSSLPAQTSVYEPRDAPSFENVVAKKTDLKDHLSWQLQMSHCTPDQMEIGAYIIGNIEPDGYLMVSLDEIAQATGRSVEEALAVLTRIQDFDPPGVAARDLAECLLIQWRQLYGEDELAEAILRDHLPDLERRDYQGLAKALGADLEDLVETIGMITALEPKPGRTYSADEPVYISPDIYLYKMGDDYAIVLNEDGLPRLRVNQFYKQALTNRDDKMEPQAKEYIQDKLRSAVWLIRSIQQRQRTIYKVTESIVNFQRDFLDRGISHLRPLVLRDVAEDVGMHESTISRVTTNKYVHTPQGLFELKYFFNSAIPKGNGQSVASEAVKEAIRRIITNEDPTRPLSDQAIADMLRQKDILIARRTVAKYREMLGMSSSSRRRRKNAAPWAK
ncbi:MAG: RNA polymerase factor sigma-54 [Proteobacteria bacterium]|nr:RNA polymerase factor sigma-54 [Pseudomonadota bacterium]MBU1742406.1 RNA polymerase factor sigma-54 [Pseudomonadota bacterium]